MALSFPIRPQRGPRKYPDPLTEVAEILRSLNLIVGLDQILDNLCAKLREILNAGTVFVVLFEPITNRYTARKARGPGEALAEQLNFSHSNHLIRWLTVNRCSLDVAAQPEVMQYLSPHERDQLHKSGTVLVVPLIVVNRLTGALFLTAKANGAVYGTHDDEILSLLTSHTALAIEHALMYEFQEERLRKIFHADQLALVGELAAGAAHEIKNPLTSIRSTAQYLRKDLPAEKHPLADGIIEEVDRIDGIIKGLLSLSKSADLHIGRVDLQDIVDQTLLLLEPELRRQKVEFGKDIGITDTIIDADAAQLKQLFLNIFLNSIQAMPEGGTITCSLSDAESARDGFGSAESVIIGVRDTGTGIPAAALPRVFDPFFTTKEDGTGLGLSISFGIVTKHGGEIEIESPSAGATRGTTVTIRLPRKAARA